MNIEITEYKGEKIIALSGDVDMYSSPALREKLMDLVKRKIPKKSFLYRQFRYSNFC
jgi:anti-anti-sigma regulatory factor